MSKSLKYYYDKVKGDPDKMEKRRKYYKDYYQRNKKPSEKKKQKNEITILSGRFLLCFD